MIRISRLTDYAMVLMSYLAVNPSQVASADYLANEVHIPFPTVSKVLKILLGSGLLKSFRGTGGGYQLARPAEEITLGQVVAAVEGDLAMVDCCGQATTCSLDSLCSIKENWQFINRVIMKTLSQYRLSDMSKPFPDRLPPVLNNIPVKVEELSDV